MIVPVTSENFAACYGLLEQTFPTTELDSRARMLAELTERSDPQQHFFMLARHAGERVVSLIAACYLTLREGNYGIGFIEYLVTDPDFRRQGHATALLVCAEQEMVEQAFRRGERLALILGEVEPELVSFKQRRGYQCLAGSQYAQPPIAFDPNTGQPLSEPIPLTLMVKPCDPPVTNSLVLNAVRLIFQKRYGPTLAAPIASERAMAYIMQHVYEPFAASLAP